MPVSLSVPLNTPYTSQELVLSNVSYTLRYRINRRYDSDNPRIYMDIFLQDEPVILGIKILPNTSLTGRYQLAEFDDGVLFCLQTGKESFPSLGNVGIDREYSIVYYTNEELEALAEES